MEHLQGHIHHSRPEYMPLFLIRYQSRRMYKKQLEPTILRRWTMSAKECLDRGCVCDGCKYSEYFKGTRYKCQMKKYVIALVKKFGHPKDVQTKTIIGEK